jgi:hypothetical protein
LLFDGESIERLRLCVKTKAITRCRAMSRASFERKLIDGNQEGDNEKFKTDKGFYASLSGLP